MSEIKLGVVAKCAITGFQGIVVQILEHLNGNIQYGLQPEVKADAPAGTYPDAMFLDYHLVDYVSAGVSARATPVTFHTTLELGNIVKDSVTDFKGTATHKTTYLNGCVAFLVSSKLQKDGTTSNDWFDQTRLKYVSAGVAKTKIKPKAAPNGKNPGGAPMKVSRSML